MRRFRQTLIPLTLGVMLLAVHVVASDVAAQTVGETFRDCPECSEMVVIPAGSFTMGSPRSEPDHRGDEGPQHSVRIPRPFALGKYEVTFAEWDACVSVGAAKDWGWGRDNRPVINVNWDDAKAYVQWLSRKTGEEYRLPSEAEWEYAARAGTKTPFHTGERIATAQANFHGEITYNGSSKGQNRQQTIPVGSFSPNRFGVYDMHGNVWEWVEDCWNKTNDTYRGAPADGSPRTTGKCSFRELRGGSWKGGPTNMRSANRHPVGTYLRNPHIGFRVARTLTP